MRRLSEACSRSLIRGFITAFTGVVLVLAQSVFWTPAVSAWMRVTVIVVAVIAYFRPKNGLLTIAALIPLSQLGSRRFGSQMRGAEALVLAFLAGVLVREWTLRRSRSLPSSRLETSVLIFGVIVAASCMEQLWFLQLQSDYPSRFTQDVLEYASTDYLIAVGPFGMISNAMLLLEGVLVLLFAALYCRSDPEFAPRLVRMTVLGAAAAATVTLLEPIGYLLRTGQSPGAFTKVLLTQRTATHVGDINAAASFFGMMVLVCFGVAYMDGASRRVWAIPGGLILVAFWSAGSRTAVICMLAIGAIATAKALVRSSTRLRTWIMVTVLLIAGGLMTLRYFPVPFFSGTASSSVASRWMLLGTTARMLGTDPLFGIGVGEYQAWSLHFSSPELVALLQRSENAHNQFAQIAGEMGLVGLTAFISVLSIPLIYLRRSGGRHHSFARPALLGSMMFMATWIGGHPLLVPETSYPFWMMLGVASWDDQANWDISRGAMLVLAATLLLAVSIPVRVDHKFKSLPVTSHQSTKR